MWLFKMAKKVDSEESAFFFGLFFKPTVITGIIFYKKCVFFSYPPP